MVKSTLYKQHHTLLYLFLNYILEQAATEVNVMWILYWVILDMGWTAMIM